MVFRNYQRTKMILPSPEKRPQYSPMIVQPTTKEAFVNHGIPIKRKLIIPVSYIIHILHTFFHINFFRLILF